jgi:hypothetical protein
VGVKQQPNQPNQSTQHIFITQTGIGTAIDLNCHFKKRQKKQVNTM